MTLLNAPVGTAVRLASLTPELRGLDRFGLFVGAELRVLSVSRVGVILRTGGVTYATDRRTAAKILVRLPA